MSEPDHLRETRRWLRYAEEDLRLARALLKRQYAVPRQVCWLAQQAAEKAIKAALVFLQADFPRRHDLDVLRNLLPDGWSLRAEQPDLASLSEWSVEARYPGDWPEATMADASEAVRQADAVWSSVRLDLARRGLDAQPPNGGDAPAVVTPQQ